MTSLIEYRKEFEEIILKGKLLKDLKTLVPNSAEHVYVEFCEEYKKCCSEKKITPKLNNIIEQAKNKGLRHKLIQILETKRDLLEYDLPSTSKEKKDNIIDELFKKYCNVNLNYDSPFFVREKKSTDNQKDKLQNKTPMILTEKMIKNEVENDLKRNERDKLYKIRRAPEKKRHKIFLEILKKDKDICLNIIYNRIKIPFYLMTKDEFTEIIEFFNQTKKDLSPFDYSTLTIEQIERLLKEVNNQKYVNKENLVSFLMNKKYNKLLYKARNANNLDEIKKILWEIHGIFKEYTPDLTQIVLLFILKINKEKNILELEPFIEYIKNPIIDSIYIQRNYYNKEPKNHSRYSFIHIPTINFNQINKHQFIEDLLIDFFINNKAKPDDFNKYFKQQYLEKIEYIAKMYKGEDMKFDDYLKYLSNIEYEEICKKTELTLCEHNPKEFKVDEEVKVDFDFKNTKEINISIYEINTENYYLTKKAPLNSLINVEGIIASKTMDMKIEGGENPLKRIRKTITLDLIPKGKPGVYLVEILGNGISSRIIIKKGRLNLISRNTSKGILCQIIDEKNEILKDDKTYLWYNGNKFYCEQKEGFIILPYKALVDSSNKCILVHDSYADITEIKRKTENYKLQAYFNILNESIIPGNMLKVNFKPLLFSNGREASLELIKKGTITVEMKKSENKELLPVTTIFENVSFKDDNKEYEFEVLIPPMMTEMKFKFNCEIKNNDTGEKWPQSYEQNSKFQTSNNQISKYLFHKVGKNYIYENIGRNGENITNKAGTNANIRINTDYHLNTVNVKLQYDEKGRLNLGELKNVIKINLENIWYNLNDYSKYCYPERIDIIQGETFTLPLYSNNKITLDDDYFQLYQFYNNKEEPSVLKDIKKEIILKELDINGDKEHYYEFTIGQNLKKGKYYLSFGNVSNITNIVIKVKEGNHWMNLENYIINEKGYVENSQIKTPIYMKNLKIDKEKGEIKFECAKTKRDIKKVHANIYLSQYQNPDINIYFNKYWNMLNEGTENLIKNKYSQWKNIYLSNRILNEEIQYVIQRRNLDNQLGNSLQMPSLLLKRTFKRDCENEEEKLEKGNEYDRKDADMGPGVGSSFGRGMAKGDEININTDFYNFLKNSGYCLNNIEPVNINSNEENAKFEIKFDEKEKDILKKYSYIQIILMDNKSISSDFHCLCKDNDKFEIEKRNISNEKALDSNKNISEIKKTELIKKGEKFNINETSNYKLVDSIQKLSKFYLLTLNNKDKYWDKFKFILNLKEDKFNEEEFLENYNEVCGHEVNLFLYFKYPKLFDKYVKNILKYKFEKTFIDYFLLDDYDTLLQYLTPLKISLLDTDELCLLMLKIVEKKPEEAKKIKDIIKSRVKKPEDVENILLTNFNIMMNMRVEEDKELLDIKDEMELEEEDQICEECYCEGEDENANECYEERTIRMPKMAKAPMTDFMEMKMMAKPMMAQKMMAQPMMAANCLNNCIPKNSYMQADFLSMEKTKEFDKAFQMAIKEMDAEFEKPGVAKEYKERHYYIKEHKNEIKNPLWLDLAEYIIKNKTHKNFLSKYVLYNEIEFNEFLLILSIIGIPIESVKHEYKRVPGSRLISINPGSNLILFTKELTETQILLNNKLLISQNVIDELHNDMNVNTNNCAIGITYSHQSIVTNISNKSIVFQLFIEIPEGAICLNSTYYTNSIKLKLNPYETQNHKTQFYFPKEGKYPQYHPVACKNSNIISIGNSLVYDVKKEYIPSKKREVIENNKYAKDMRIEGKLRNILSDDSADSKTKLNNILNYFKNDIFNNEDIQNVLYLLKDNKDFYINLITTLRNRGYYTQNVWGFAFHHKDEKGIKEYLKTINDIKIDLGYDFKSSLYTYSEIDDAKIHPHLEYSPLYNARKHPFGNKNDNNETNIANKEFNETYRKFIIDLLSVKELSVKEKLQLTYYLILQDRMEEAFEMFNKIKKEEIDENKNKSFKIQYDYINAYLDFCFGYPEFKIAKSICNKYKDFPLNHWREKFEEIEDALFIYENKEKITMDDIENETNNKKALKKELREKEPKLSYSIDSKDGNIVLLHSNITEINISLYFIDLETMFTRDPKISEIMNKDKKNESNNMKENFGFVQPNYSETIKISEDKIKNDNSTLYQIPKEYKNKNLFIEIKAESFKLFDIYLSSNLLVTITESLGELRVLKSIDNKLKPIIKAYVKVYVELNNKEVQFYKDGYTDLNGKFNYLALNTDQLKKAEKFYIYVSEEKEGAIIKECYPPKNIARTGGDNLLEDIQRYRQIQRNQWRLQNKI